MTYMWISGKLTQLTFVRFEPLDFQEIGPDVAIKNYHKSSTAELACPTIPNQNY